jgi:hypothetical protein
VAGLTLLDLIQHCPGRTYLTRGTVTALIAIVLHKSLLHRMQLLRSAQAFDGRHICAIVHNRERQAGVNAPSIDYRGARTALSVVASLLGARHSEMIPQQIE